MQAAVLVCTPLVIASCDDVFGDVDNPIPSYMSIKKDAVVLEMHAAYPEKATFTRTATAATGAEIVYSSTNEEIATVDATTGKITAVGAGDCKIIVTATGKDSNGRMTYQELKDSFPVTVKDWRARIALTEDAKPVILNVADYVAAPATTVDLTEVLDVWPALGTDGLNIVYTKVDNNKGQGDVDPDKIITSVAGGKITLSGKTGMAKVIASIPALANVPDGYEITSFAEELETDTFTIKVKEGIAYMAWDSEKGKTVRKTMFLVDEGATKPNYTKLSDMITAGISANETLKGWYYFDQDAYDANTGATAYDPTLDNRIYSNFKAGGDVNIIVKDGVNVELSGSFVDDNPAAHALNVFGQKTGNGRFAVMVNGDAVIDFKDVNLYGGNFDAYSWSDGCGGFNKNGAINIFEGHLNANNYSGGHGYGIKGAVNLKGYNAFAWVRSSGTNADDSYAIIGDVTVEKGELEASSDYRAINGTVTATKAKQCDDTTWSWNPTKKTWDGTWADFTGTPGKKFVWALGEEEPEE
jgi:hypothetical protein